MEDGGLASNRRSVVVTFELAFRCHASPSRSEAASRPGEGGDAGHAVPAAGGSDLALQSVRAPLPLGVFMITSCNVHRSLR